MDFKRILRHLFTGPLAVCKAFPATALTAIEYAIAQSEFSHRGEIRFAVEAALDMLPLVRATSARERAVEVFSQLRVWDTEHNNGVLIYLLLADHNVEIVADRGIDAKVGHEKWETICREMETHFSQGQFESGVISGIRSVGGHLQTHFPAGREGGKNELPDWPVII
ncbi:TPM domain-containing protein [Nitrosospira multiformis]|uniref:TPM domain-containing protein n=1 Tax=Nitrosospira multiformis TaxID=1231 RepID=UPI000899DD17|nr:TPM domain-containing protein [Nitrosospira multiformis]SEA52812.1 TLP18.3, Psb32 and MOLO-1 founding protein of phosphatase [Nitrosospira multiformis]